MFHSNSWLHTTPPVCSAQSMASVQCPKPHNSQYQWRYASLCLSTGSFLLHICGKQCTKPPRIPQPACGKPKKLKKVYPIIASFSYLTWLDEELPPKLAKAMSGKPRPIVDTFTDTAVSFRV